MTEQKIKTFLQTHDVPPLIWDRMLGVLRAYDSKQLTDECLYAEYLRLRKQNLQMLDPASQSNVTLIREFQYK